MWSIETDDFQGLCGDGDWPLLRAINKAIDGNSDANTTTTATISTTSTTMSSTSISTTKPSSSVATTVSPGRCFIIVFLVYQINVSLQYSV